ncbi:PREDICTED: uncharacterized protein LOC105962297, partial [Erythranthe guttata]|uniref:uncharacterized protein LOC105962297 n=1 Tax=Erythranthe guttata TaxID=4155 RepID=UPI00064DC1E6
MRIASTSANSSSMNSEQGDIPIAEALRCQIEVQKTLQQQLEVQKKLQMRIEAEGKYLQSILEKAQHSLSPDINQSENLELTKSQLTDFNLALSNLMQTINGDEINGNKVARETRDHMKLETEGPLIEFDLNSRSSYDFIGINNRAVLGANQFENRLHDGSTKNQIVMKSTSWLHVDIAQTVGDESSDELGIVEQPSSYGTV